MRCQLFLSPMGHHLMPFPLGRPQERILRLVLWWDNLQNYSSKPCDPAAALFGSHIEFLQNCKVVIQNDAWPLIHWSLQAWELGWEQALVSGRVKIHGAEKIQGFENKPNQECSQLSRCQTYCAFTVVPNPFDVLFHLIFPVTLWDNDYLLFPSTAFIHSLKGSSSKR